MGDSLMAAARFAGSIAIFQIAPGACAPGFMLPPAPRAQSLFFKSHLGLAPQALCCRPLRGLNRYFSNRTWGLRPRLYAAACFAACFKPIAG